MEYSVAVAVRTDDPDRPAQGVDSSQAHLRLTWRAPTRASVSGLIREARVWSGAPDRPLLQATNVAITGTRANGVLQLTASAARNADPSACASGDWGYLAWARDVDLALPETVAPDQRWTDSASYDVCRSGIPLHIRLVRRFRALSISPDSGTAVVERSSSVTVRGDLSTGDDTTAVFGEGGGTLRYELELPTGRPLRASGRAQLTLTARNKTSRSIARQASTIEIARAPRP